MSARAPSVRLSTRLFLVGVAAPVTALTLALVLVGALLDGALRDAMDRALLAQAAVESVSLFDQLGHAAHLHVDRSPLRLEAGGSPAWGALYGPDGRRLLAVPEGAPVPARVSLPPLGAAPVLETEAGPGEAGQRVLRVTVASPEGVSHALRLAVPLDRHRATMRSYARLATGAGALVALALLAAQGALLRALLRRIRDLNTHLGRMRAGDLAHAPAPDPTGDELAELRDELAAATEELRGARDARERLLADAAHELRTPLAAIRTDVEVTLRRERSLEELRETLGRVREETLRLGALAQQLLDLAATGRRAWKAEEGDLEETALAAVAGMRALAEEAGVTLAVEGAARGRYELDGVTQVLANLLGNALGVSPRGGVVTVRVAREGERLSLAVEDQGPGVPEAERRLIFEPFHRLSREGTGAGLGLAIVRDLAMRHGGDARVEDAPGGGARFVVSWPG